jgi:preprotein translocase subunit SecA
MMAHIRLQICTGLFRNASNIDALENMLALLSRSAHAQGPADATPSGAPQLPHSASGGGQMEAPAEKAIELPKVTIRREMPKVGRNDPCPCGSGKKFKNCHGQ